MWRPAGTWLTHAVTHAPRVWVLTLGWSPAAGTPAVEDALRQELSTQREVSSRLRSEVAGLKRELEEVNRWGVLLGLALQVSVRVLVLDAAVHPWCEALIQSHLTSGAAAAWCCWVLSPC